MTLNINYAPYISRITAALLDSMGWYEVNYNLTESSNYGKNKGCGFLDPENCQF